MKVLALVLCALLVSSAQAGIIDELKGHLTGVGDLLKGVGGHLKEQGAVVLKQLLEQAKQAGNQLLQTTLLKALEQMGTQVGGKRNLGMLQRIEESRQWLENHFEKAKGQVDSVMEESLEKLKAVAEKILNLKFLESENPEEIVEEIENAIQHQSAVTRGFVEAVFRELLEQARPSLDKRFIKDTLQRLVDYFSPHVNAVTKVFKEFASTLRGHATNVASVLKSKSEELKVAMNLVATELKTKLGSHVDELKMHGEKLKQYGKEGYAALLTAVTDILTKTASNVATTSKTALSQTVANVAKTITDQLVQMMAKGN